MPPLHPYRKRISRLLSCLGVTTALAALSVVAVAPVAHAIQSQAPLTLADLPDGPYPTVAAGPGVVVCEPVPQATEPDLADFGAGCGRWLEFTLGANPELDQSPAWHELNRIHTELHRENLRLPWPQAAQLGSLYGVTHVVVGEISGKASQCTLTYHLYDLATKQEVGTGLQASGSDQAVLDQLPQLARKLLGRLSVKTPQVPEKVEAAPEAMRLLGRYVWFQNEPIAKEDVHQMYVLGKRLPLAELFYLRKSGHNAEEPTQATLTHLLTQAPENTHVLAEALRGMPAALDPYKATIEANAKRYPNNYVYTIYTFIQHNRRKEMKARLQTALHLVACAPHHPNAWTFLEKTYSEAAEQVRRGRFPQQMSEEELRFVNRIYPLWFDAAQHAIQLDPTYGFGWQELAVAGTFVGEEKIADEAFWKAVNLVKNDADLYWWGLNMYQPKWLRDQDKLARVAKLAMEQKYPTGRQTAYVASALEGAGFRTQAQTLYDRALEQYREAVKERPNEAAAHADLARALQEQGHPEAARAEWKRVLQLAPNSELGREARQQLQNNL